MKKILILLLVVFPISLFSGCQKDDLKEVIGESSVEMQSDEIEGEKVAKEEWEPITEMGGATLVETPTGFTARDVNKMKSDTIVMWDSSTGYLMERGHGRSPMPSPIFEFLSLCVEGGGNLVSPTSVFGGGSVCSDENIVSRSWPDLMEGIFVYGEVSNEKIEFKAGGSAFIFCDTKTKKCEESQGEMSELEKEKRGYASAVLFSAMQDIFYCHNKKGIILQPKDSLMGGGNMCSIELSLGGEKLTWKPVNDLQVGIVDEKKYSYGKINEDLISLNYQGSPTFCCKVKKGFCGGPELCE